MTAECVCRVTGSQRCSVLARCATPGSHQPAQVASAISRSPRTRVAAHGAASPGGDTPGARRGPSGSASVPCCPRSLRALYFSLSCCQCPCCAPAPLLCFSALPPTAKLGNRITQWLRDPKGSAVSFPCAGAKGEEAATAHGATPRGCSWDEAEHPLRASP